MRQEIRFHIPKNEWMTSNQRDHKNVRNQKVKALRTRAEMLVKSLIQRGGLTKPEGRVRFTVTAIYRSGVGLDDDNCQPSFKAIRDGMVRAGLIEDDNAEHVESTTYTASVKDPRLKVGEHALRVEIEEVMPNV